MLHPSTRLTWVHDDVGYGVVATERIPQGTILWALDPLDRLLSPSDVRNLGSGLWPALETYTYVNGRGERVLCWDHGRFMNHSCDPVSLSPGVDFELAVRDIEAGEEITCDYTSLNLEQDLRCLCGHPACRSVVSSDDFEGLAPVWDERLRAAVRHVTSVPQPLLSWVRDAGQLERWAQSPDELPSALRHRYPIRDVVATASVGRR
jgi:hypothetical protein